MEAGEYIEEIDFQKYWLVIRRRWLAATLVFAGTVALAGAYAMTRTDSYEASGKLLFQSDNTPSLTGVGENLGRLEPLTFNNNPLDTKAVIVKSNTIVTEAITTLNLRNDEGELLAPQKVKERISAKGVPGTDVLTVTFTDEDPELSAAVVNELMRLYLEYDVRTNRAEASAARRFLEKELPSAERTVNLAAEALRQFKAENGVVELQAESRVAVENLAELNNQISQVTSELARVRTRSRELAQTLGISADRALDISALNQAPGVQQALTQLQEVESNLARERSRYTSDHPVVQNLELERQGAYGLLQEQVAQVLGAAVEVDPGTLQQGELKQTLMGELVQAEVERLSLGSSIDTLMETRNGYLEWASEFPALEKRQLQLENRLEAAQSTYESLLLRQQEIQLAENQNVGTARILDEANVPEFAAGTSKKLYLAAGGFVGILLAIATAFLLDLIDRTLKTVQEAEAVFGYPLLGVIPKYRLADAGGMAPAEPMEILNTGLYPMVADAYQMLQANLKFVSSDTRVKSFVVTSSVSGEGKTSVAALLAMTIAQTGRRVLLVDGDMRAPAQHHVWGKVNQIGLSHVLVGEGELSEALQPVADNLTLMAAGVTPPNPLALVDSEQMAGLLSELVQRFDAVILDAPPLARAADGAILGKLADGVMLVARPRVVDSGSAAAAKSLLDRSGAMVLGLVANGVDVKTEHEDYVPYTARAMDKKGLRAKAAAE